MHLAMSLLRSIEKVSVLAVVVLLVFESALAQHPIDVQRKSASGAHFEALTIYEKMPKRRRTAGSQLAAANSSWALGLADQAIQEFDSLLRGQSLTPTERAKTHLSRAIIEFQEHRYRVANLYVEKTISLLPESHPLRSKAWLLWGDSLYELKSYGAAEDKYLRSLDEASNLEQGDIHYRLGICRIKLGESDAAKASFESIPLSHERTSESVRHLSRLSLEEGQYDHAAFWLEKAKSEFGDQFLDSWVDYAMVKVALEKGDLSGAEEIRVEAEKKYPESDSWYSMLVAAIEVYRAKRVMSEG